VKANASRSLLRRYAGEMDVEEVAAMWGTKAKALQVIGLALNVLGTALIFLFAYPGSDERRGAMFVRVTRMALLLMFCGFMLQLVAAYDPT
jgi:hypothetical protein